MVNLQIICFYAPVPDESLKKQSTCGWFLLVIHAVESIHTPLQFLLHALDYQSHPLCLDQLNRAVL